MLKILIVEDEMLVRIGIKSSIDWSKYGMTVIADVGNGQAAWEVYQRERPDIILTDIKMPVMDGIKLIEKIRNEDSRTRIIILSCLDEFEYCRRALALGVSGYILKLTMSQEEMEAVLEKAISELPKDNIAIDKDGDNNLKIFKDKIILDYLFHGNYTEGEFSKLVKEMNLPLRPENLVLCIVEIDHYHIMKNDYGEEHVNSNFLSIVNAINELLDRYQAGIACHEKDNRFIIILCFSDITDEKEIKYKLFDLLSHLRRTFLTYFDNSVTFGISGINCGYSSLGAMYIQVVEAIAYKFFVGFGKNIEIQAINPEVMKNETVERLKAFLKTKENQFLSGLDGETKMFPNPPYFLKDEITRIFMDFGHKAMVVSNLNVDDISKIVFKYEQQIRNCETLDEVIAVFEESLEKIVEIRNTKKYYKKRVATTIKYVEEHFSENISLQQIAEKMELHPNYLSGLFKLEFGMGFIEFVSKFRIDKAKELLLNTNLKSYEISDKVGFTDESYFSRTFKKITGMTPNEFRNKPN